MNIQPWKRAMAFIAVAAYLATGCASLQRVAVTDVKVGESVVVQTSSGETKKFTVTAVENDALVGRDVRVAKSEIAALDVRRSGEGANKGLIIGAVVVGVLAIAAAAGGGGGGGGGGY